MADYIHHTNNVIDRAAGLLPTSWDNVSGLDKASPESLKEKGWLPVVYSIPEYDSATQRLTGPTGAAVGDPVTPGADSVTASYSVVTETSEAFMASMIIKMQQRLDAWAQEKGYDGILSLCSYAASTIPQFAAEAAIGMQKRDETWATGYVIIGEIVAGTRQLPTEEELFALLPQLIWE